MQYGQVDYTGHVLAAGTTCNNIRDYARTTIRDIMNISSNSMIN